ncbi:MAG: ATP synthase F1 subunit delta [Planctomycetota bacterium]
MAATAEHHDPAALSYAQALIELAESRDQLQPTADEVDALRKVLDENPKFAQFLADPGIDREERSAVLQRTFASASPLMQNFLKLVEGKGRIGHLPGILAAFESILDEKLGKIEVNVTVAQQLGEAQIADVKNKVSAKLGKDAVVHQFVDPDIIGGMVIKVQDQVIDASVRSRLDSMKKRLKQS